MDIGEDDYEEYYYRTAHKTKDRIRRKYLAPFFKKIILRYIKKYKNYGAKQISLFYRFGLFFRNKRFYSKPLLALGVIFLKSLEYISAGIGCVVDFENKRKTY